MAVIGYDVTLEAAVTEFLATGYSRLPVIAKNIDDITGVLYLKDVTRALVTNRDGAAITTAASKARPAMFVPESKPVDELLRDMQQSATHIAIVVDEYGGVAGLVTMEDVIEEIVGEIADEYDRELPDVVEVSERVLLVSAKYSLFDLGERFGIDIEDDDVDSVGGLLNKQLGRLPTKGDSVVASGLRLTAERFEGRPKRLMRVLVEPSQDLVEAQKAFEDNDN
jgi:CBS domain containing-hemolysin-like protein